MKIAREYSVDCDSHHKISLFDEDIAGQSEAEITDRVNRMLQADPPRVTVTRMWTPPLLGDFDLDTMTDEEIHAAVQVLLDDIRENDEAEE